MTAQHPFTYAGDTALVSGAASGIGRATAATLASAGLTVLLLDRDGDGAIAAAAELGPECRAEAADVADERQVAGTVTLQFLGGLLADGGLDTADGRLDTADTADAADTAT